MEHEQGDIYLRRLATFIRTNERGLAEAGITKRRRTNRPPHVQPMTVLNPLSWFGLDAPASSPALPAKPVVLSTDVHHLFYTLMRLEALGYDIGSLDVEFDSPSRPTVYVDLSDRQDKSDTLSLASFRSSFSAVSSLSLGSSWWSRSEASDIHAELKYILSSFTKLPALSIHAPEKKVIAELMDDPPSKNALPLDIFRNLQNLECVDIDPRTLLGWDRLAVSLRSLRIKKSGLEDVSDIFIGAVIDDQARRKGSASRKRRRIITRQTSFHSTQLPDVVIEDEDGENSSPDKNDRSPTSSAIQLSTLNWASLKHLSLPDNSLTFFPTEPLAYLTSVTHLDLSSNLFVSVPLGLGILHNLVSLNLSDNMIDSVLGIYQNLGQVLYLNLSNNRLESICGLERLLALERVDLRSNLIEESAEVGRLATLPNIAEVYVQGNPFVEIEETYRIACFDYFWREGKTITLDGTQPGFYEKRNLSVAPPEQMSSNRPLSNLVPSPPVVAVGHAHVHTPSTAPASLKTLDHALSSSDTSPHLTPIAAVGVGRKAGRKKVKRIVDLGGGSEASSRSASHIREVSDDSAKERPQGPPNAEQYQAQPSPLETTTTRKWGQVETLGEDADLLTPYAEEIRTSFASQSSSHFAPSKSPKESSRRRHGRYLTEYSYDAIPEISTTIPRASSGTPPPTTAVLSKAAKRQARMSASLYERSNPLTGVGDGEDIRDNAEAYRRRIESLKQDMGDGWLKVFSQSEMKSP